MDERTVTYQGEEFRLADKIALMAVADFAEMAAQGADTDTMEGLITVKTLLRQCIAEDEWARFHALSIKSRDAGDGLLAVVKQVLTGESDRPTKSPSDSSDGPSPTSGSSTGGSSSPVVNRLEQQGRPDLALIVTESLAAREARAS